VKVLAVYDNPTVLVAGYNASTVIVAGYDDHSVLDLVAHFLGIATHHNDNAVPTSIAALEVISGAKDI